jgi:hypothetical protein
LLPLNGFSDSSWSIIKFININGEAYCYLSWRKGAMKWDCEPGRRDSVGDDMLWTLGCLLRPCSYYWLHSFCENPILSKREIIYLHSWLVYCDSNRDAFRVGNPKVEVVGFFLFQRHR